MSPAGRSDDRPRSRSSGSGAPRPPRLIGRGDRAWAALPRPPPRRAALDDPPDRPHQLPPVPGDARLAGAVILRGTPERHARSASRQTRERWGLDKPLFPDQFVAYLGRHGRGRPRLLVRRRGQTVTEVLAQRIWPTLLLFGLGELIAIVVGLALGAYSGWKRGGPVDYVGNGASLILYSTPYFLLGMGLLLIFATGLGWFPTFGMVTAGATYDSAVDQPRRLPRRTWSCRSRRSRSG